jgi:hypothetical protein
MSTQLSIGTDCGHTAWRTDGTQYLYPTGKRELISDTVVPNFHKRKASGEVFFNPMFYSLEEAERSKGGQGPERFASPYWCPAPWNNYRATGYRDDGNQLENLYSVSVGQSLVQGRLPPLGTIIQGNEASDLLNQHATSVMNQRGRGDTNLFETLAEADKSLRLLSDTIGTLNKSIAHAVLRTRVKSFASLWLMYRYAWMPLVQDTVVVVKGIHKKVGALRQTSRSQGTIERSSTRAVEYSNIQMTISINEVTTDRLRVRCMSLDEYVSSMYTNIGLTSKGLMTLPWELIPYSFVVDWFVNVGDYIGAVTPAFGWKQLGSCHVMERERRIYLAATSTVAKPNWSITMPCTGTYSYKVLTRHRLPYLPTPSLVIKSDFRFSNFNRVMDSVGLLLQKIK